MHEPDKKACILIVDDMPVNIQLLATILSAQDYEIHVAQDGIEALEKVEITKPDLILLDIMMPKLDGFETCRQLKKNEKTHRIPIIFLTAKIDTKSITEGFELGAVDYVTKPFNPLELLARVKTHLELTFRRKLTERQNNERKQLLHVLSHDLINSLSGSIFMLEQLDTNPLVAHQMKYVVLKGLKNSVELVKLGRQLRSLVDQEFSLQLTKLNLQEGVGEAAEIVKRVFAKKNIELEINISETLNVLTEQVSFVNVVLANLLTNAIKFSYPGSIITIDATQNGEEVAVSIKDQGIGMSEQLLGGIFDFNQMTIRKGTDGEQGTGYGMSLVRSFMHAYGGSIEVFSKEQMEGIDEHGTEVKLVLKQAESD